MKLDAAALRDLRDVLIERGRPSVLPATPISNLTLEDDELRAQAERVAPICEVLFLMMGADGHCDDAERELLRGAVRALTDGALRTRHIDAMLAGFEAQLAREGRAARLLSISNRLQSDRADAEAAFSLAAAMALADNQSTADELALLDEFGELLGLSVERRSQLTRASVRRGDG